MIKNIIKSIVQNKIGVIGYPHFVTYLVTQRCNLRCIFCDVWKNQNTIDNELTLPQIEKVFSQLSGCDIVRISGGEPFIRPDIVDVITTIDACVKPTAIHITTNGTFTERVLDLIDRFPDPRKINLKISIDSIDARNDEIRGVEGAYKKAMTTLKALTDLRKKKGFSLGVNCGIVNESDFANYYLLKKELDSMGIAMYSVIANNAENALYSNKVIVSHENSVKPFGDFSKAAIEKYIAERSIHIKENCDFFGKIVETYHLKGLENRLLYGKKKPNPHCVALRSHVRILPNGDIPVCLFNGNCVGNLVRETLEDIWFHKRSVDAQRKWVSRCSGCWQSCESIVSAIYTGDIYKGLFYK
jgi:MoaA/NifB/PqqE/SkfB family radical SAM enzyme